MAIRPLPLTLEKLEKVACEVIQPLQDIPDIAKFELVVVGGMAVQKHTSNDRITMDIDFLVTVPLGPKSIKERLLKTRPDCFVEISPARFVYRSSNALDMTVNMIPDFQVPYMPASAMPISTIPRGKVPYIGIEDLLVFKIWLYGMRFSIKKQAKDIRDIFLLVGAASRNGLITFSTRKRLKMLEGVPDLFNRDGVFTGDLG